MWWTQSHHSASGVCAIWGSGLFPTLKEFGVIPYRGWESSFDGKGFWYPSDCRSRCSLRPAPRGLGGPVVIAATVRRATRGWGPGLGPLVSCRALVLILRGSTRSCCSGRSVPVAPRGTRLNSCEVMVLLGQSLPSRPTVLDRTVPGPLPRSQRPRRAD